MTQVNKGVYYSIKLVQQNNKEIIDYLVGKVGKLAHYIKK